MERVRTYFGFKAVADIRILQGPLPEKPEKKPSPAPLDEAKRQELNKKLTLVTDPDLKAALESLGTEVIRDR